MATPVLMPQAGQSMTEGKIVRWIVKEGAAVRKGDPILEIETDKANMEVEAPADGILRKTLRPEGDVVPVLTLIAVIAGEKEVVDLEAMAKATSPQEPAATVATPSATAPIASQPSAAARAEPGPAPSRPAVPPQVGSQQGGGRSRPAASPLARRLAARKGIDLRGMRGSGPRGRIIRRDVESVVVGSGPVSRGGAGTVSGTARGIGTERPERPLPPSPRPPARVPLAGMRKAIATALQKSKVQAPHFYATIEIDLTEALALRKTKEEEGLRVSVNDMIVRAIAIALTEEPRVNCRVSDEAIEYPEDVNIGIAVGLDDGLVVPVVMRAQARSLPEVADETRRIIELARGGKLVGAGQGTFTISNLGMFGIKCFTAVINPPEGAILAVGKAIERAVPAGRGFLPRTILEATLSADHRAIDGLLAARFLARLRSLLEEPARIL
jgi:pyruvate dehydrogenase E2 component (dihydrolipoamide acetyltransferase)